MSMHKLALRFDWYQTCLSGPLVDLATQYANQYINTLPSKGKGVRPNERNKQIRLLVIHLLSSFYQSIHSTPSIKGWISVPSGNSEYGLDERKYPSRIHYPSKLVSALMNWLVTNHHVSVIKGTESAKRTTRVKPAGALLRDLKSIEWQWLHLKPLSADSSTIVRDRVYAEDGTQTGKKIDVELEKSGRIHHQNRKINVINTCYKRHCFCLSLDDHQLEEELMSGTKDKKQTITFQRDQITRIYSIGRTDRGGRLYRPWWQYVRSHLREKILIDGYPTSEIDFSGVTFRLLYAKAKIDYPADIDVYNLGFDDWQGSEDPRRKIIKKFVNAVFNDEEEKYHPGKDALKLLGCGVKELREKLYKTHEAAGLRDSIVSGWGLESHFRDSQIALAILHYFACLDIPVLSVHDSFIIDRRYTDTLNQVMERAFKIFTDGGIVATDLEVSSLDRESKPWDFSQERSNSKMGRYIQSWKNTSN